MTLSSPLAHPIFDADGSFQDNFGFIVGGDEVLNAGSKVNDELPMNTAIFGQMTPKTGVDQNGVIELHAGFLLVGSGGMFDDATFSAGDFTATG